MAIVWLMGAALLAGEPELKQVAPEAWVLIGTSGNVLIVPSAEGTLIVDDERPADSAEIVAAVAKISPSPVRIVVDTHWHMDHSGGNAAFLAAGASVIAQRNVRVRRSTDQFMPAYDRTIPAAAPGELPTIVYDEAKDVRVGRETVELRHAPHAHTDGDTIVRLAKANVIHMGDVYFNGIWPFIDTASGGGIRGLIAAVDRVLAMADANTVIVPAHGEIAKRADLARYRDMLADVEARVRKGIAEGMTLEQVVAGKPAAAWREGMVGSEDGFVGAVYASLVG
jgi:glyoxylase-like metal-dependent hydrolase (beta-lactamase superfamily II)